MRIKVTSDGTPLGHRVVNADTGEEIDGATKVVITLEAGQLGKAVLYISEFELEATFDGVTLRT